MSTSAFSVEAIINDQTGLVTREQLWRAGVAESHVRNQARALRWRPLNDRVICTHNGPLTEKQARWAAVLSAQGPAALCGLTALADFAVTGFRTDAVHLLVVRGARVLEVPCVQVVVHESRRFSATDILPRLPPTVGLERATIDAAVWSEDVKTAMRVIAAPIQQRFTTAARLRDELTAAGQVKFRRILLPFLADLEGGAEALSEVAFLRWCRQHGFPKPELQVRLDHVGRRRYLDALFACADGRRLLVEIDGGIHLSLTTRWEDTAKDNDAAIARELTLRFPSVAIYTDDPRAIGQLTAALGICQQPASR